jgi:hypothetical protein
VKLIARLVVSVAILPGSVLATTIAGARRGSVRRAAPSAKLSVQVSDSATGGPLLRLTLVSRDTANGGNPMALARADTTGLLQVDDIPPGVRRHFEVTCEIDADREKLLDSLTVTLKPNELRRWSVKASGDGCDQRPFVVRAGFIAGLWLTGPDESAFTSCDVSIPHAWVDFRDGALDTPEAAWPAYLDMESSPAFVEWDATVIGPWHYGPKGDAEYYMFVRRVYRLKSPAPGDCKR